MLPLVLATLKATSKIVTNNYTVIVPVYKRYWDPKVWRKHQCIWYNCVYITPAFAKPARKRYLLHNHDAQKV